MGSHRHSLQDNPDTRLSAVFPYNSPLLARDDTNLLYESRWDDTRLLGNLSPSILLAKVNSIPSSFLFVCRLSSTCTCASFVIRNRPCATQPPESTIRMHSTAAPEAIVYFLGLTLIPRAKRGFSRSVSRHLHFE